MGPSPRFLLSGDRALVVEYGQTIDEAVNVRVRGLGLMLGRAAHPGIIETVPTYRSLMVHYDPLLISPADLEAAVRAAETGLADATLPPPRVVEVPTAYGGEFGPDLDDVASLNGLTPDQVMAIHAGSDYLVYMMGFMPGFPYLGGMSARIAALRLGTPRTLVPGGSVGIAGQQTGIYPTASPGGWRLIGRTPLRLFDVTQMPPVLFEAGDYVRFVRVTRDEYEDTLRMVENRSYTPVVRRKG